MWSMHFLVLLVCVSTMHSASLRRTSARELAHIDGQRRGGAVSGAMNQKVQIQDAAVQPEPVVFEPQADSLEEDLALMKPVDKSTSGTHMSVTDRPFSDPVEDEMDIMLLYGLIRAIEYETNIKLFDKVLQNMEQATESADFGNDINMAYDEHRPAVSAQKAMTSAQQTMTYVDNVPDAGGNRFRNIADKSNAMTNTATIQKVKFRQEAGESTVADDMQASLGRQQQPVNKTLSRSVSVVRMMASPVSMARRVQKVLRPI